MTAARVAKLKAIGFAWDQREAEWEAQLVRLAAYKAAHGDCSVPYVWAEDPRLGRWVSTQRTLTRKLDRGELSHGLTAARAARLTALGFVWDQNEAEWEAQLVRLIAYKAAHGDCNVPQGWAEDLRHASWVGAQRVYKRKLDRGEPSLGMTAERAARLTALGFVWDQHEAEREAKLTRLVAYKAAHGDCNVPHGWAEDPRLASWVDTQRRLKRLTLESSEASPKVMAEWAQLTARGFTWDFVQTEGI
jgi:hypothetical protein